MTFLLVYSNSNLDMVIVIIMLLGLGLVGAATSSNAYGQLINFPDLDSAQNIQEIEVPVYDQPPAIDANVNTDNKPNITSVKAIDFRIEKTYGAPFAIDVQYQNETVTLPVKQYYDCVINSARPLYETYGMEFKEEAKSEYLKFMEQCMSVQWVLQKLERELMELSPMERALKGFG